MTKIERLDRAMVTSLQDLGREKGIIDDDNRLFTEVFVAKRSREHCCWRRACRENKNCTPLPIASNSK